VVGGFSNFSSKNKMLNSLRELNDKRLIFFEIGLILALSFMLVLFNWKSVEQEFNAPIDYDPDWDRVQTLETPTPPTRQRTFAPPPPDVKISKAPLSGNIETVLLEMLETEMASTEITENDVALPASAFTGESPAVAVPAEDRIGGESEIFVVVEEMPSFPGGDQALLRFLSENLRYPSLALESHIQGLVVVQFIIDEKGRISAPSILRGIGGGCDEEAIRVVQLMPAWKPGKQRNRPVKVRYNLPVRFQLKTD
jgi:protein TonB